MKRLICNIVLILMVLGNIHLSQARGQNDALLKAAIHGNKAGMDKLIGKNEDVNTQGDYNRTPLTYASRDGNGWNDTWHIEDIEFYKNCIVEIYNRWGMKIFSSVGYPVEWDGTYNGKDLLVGVYYYVIDIFVEYVEPYTGSVSILHRGK